MVVISTDHFPADQVLRIDELDAGRAGVPFLNWRVTPLPNRQRRWPVHAFAGAGIYGVCFDGDLIYIGSFLGSGGKKDLTGVKAATFTGDIVQGRWWQHFGSLTARSHVLNVSRGTLAALQEEFGARHPMVAALLAAAPELHDDAGCLGAIDRLRFAAAQRDEFGRDCFDPQQMLRRFCYLYVRIDALPAGIDAFDLSRRIKSAEDRLIDELQPLANSVGRNRNQVRVRLTCVEAGEMVYKVLRDVQFPRVHQDDAVARTPDPQRLPLPALHGGHSSAAENFHESIGESPAARRLIVMVRKLCEELHVEIHHANTGGGDLRVRADRPQPHPREQNVITMVWRSRNCAFSCMAFASPAECVDLGLPAANLQSNTGPLPSLIKVRPGIDDEAFLFIVRRSVQKFREE